MKYITKHKEIHASRWWKNGDHPDDYSKVQAGFENGQLVEISPEYRKEHNWQGDVVKYYRHPSCDGKNICAKCGRTMHYHGWLDTEGDGQKVCPGDWVISENGKYSKMTHKEFEEKYEPAS